MPLLVFDCMCVLPDLFLQCTGEAFEFPRRDMPDTIRFVGPVLPKPSDNFKEPAWWSHLDSGRAVVLVTQGTIANFDFNELIQPTLLALADEDVLVIAATGRPDTELVDVPIFGLLSIFKVVFVTKVTGTANHMNVQVWIDRIVQVKSAPGFRSVWIGPEDDHAVLVRREEHLSIARTGGYAPLPRPDGDGWRGAVLGKRDCRKA
jgi:hypothetical protein